MRERIEDALKQHTADYVEIRIEETKSTNITYGGVRTWKRWARPRSLAAVCAR